VLVPVFGVAPALAGAMLAGLGVLGYRAGAAIFIRSA
jgi:hypothetical protein